MPSIFQFSFRTCPMLTLPTETQGAFAGPENAAYRLAHFSIKPTGRLVAAEVVLRRLKLRSSSPPVLAALPGASVVSGMVSASMTNRQRPFFELLRRVIVHKSVMVQSGSYATASVPCCVSSSSTRPMSRKCRIRVDRSALFHRSASRSAFGMCAVDGATALLPTRTVLLIRRM